MPGFLRSVPFKREASIYFSLTRVVPREDILPSLWDGSFYFFVMETGFAIASKVFYKILMFQMIKE